MRHDHYDPLHDGIALFALVCNDFRSSIRALDIILETFRVWLKIGFEKICGRLLGPLGVTWWSGFATEGSRFWYTVRLIGWKAHFLFFAGVCVKKRGTLLWQSLLSSAAQRPQRNSVGSGWGERVAFAVCGGFNCSKGFTSSLRRPAQLERHAHEQVGYSVPYVCVRVSPSTGFCSGASLCSTVFEGSIY